MTTSPTEARVQALMPCPFCGSVEGLDFSDGSTFRWLYSDCKNCGASIGEVRIQTTGEGTPEQWRKDAEQKAIAAWNTRAELGKDAERLEDFSEIRTVIHELKTYNPGGDEYKGAHIHKGWAKRLDFALSRQMTFEEAKLLEVTLEEFADCGETNTPYEQLLNWAQRGYLECTNFHSMPAAQKAIDAAIQQTKDTK